MLCTFFVYVHFSSAFNFVNGDPIRKIQSFLLVSLQNLHSVKNVPNISSRQKTILQTRLNHKLESNLDKKKKFHETIIDLSTLFRRNILRRIFQEARNSLLPVMSILPSYICPANWTTLVSPRETKNSLESKNSWTKRSKQFRFHEKESHPPQAKISSFLLTRSNLRFRSIFSSFFFFFVVSMQLLRFTATIVPHFARSHATRPAVRTVNDFESAREAHERRERVNIRAASSTTMFLFRLSWWNSSNGDARNGNRKFFGCSTGESVEFVGVALPRIFLFEGC